LEIEVRAYEDSYREQWENFIDNSANGTFLHRRSFMEYHGDRFQDASVMVWEGEELLAVFPAHREGDQIFSHKGLSFGGWIYKKGLEKNTQKNIISITLDYFKTLGIQAVSLTPVPVYYHKETILEQEELLELGFQLLDSKTTYVISLPHKIQDRGKRWGLRKAKTAGIEIQEGKLDIVFWNELLVPHHIHKLGFPPVHSWEEISQLSQNHPQNISLYMASLGQELLAGLVLFKHDQVMKIQYSALTEKGKTYRAMDFLVQELMAKCEKLFVDIGTAIDPGTKQDKKSLVAWKESFGAKTSQVNTFKFIF
jgi:hypothetical protein